MPARRAPAHRPAGPPAHLERLRLELAGGAATTLHVARYPLPATAVRVVRLAHPEPLAAWCHQHGIEEAMVGGFFVRPHGTPLGELRTRGILRRSVPFVAPWSGVRGCVHVQRGRVAVAARDELPADPPGGPPPAGPPPLRRGGPGGRDGGHPPGLS